MKSTLLPATQIKLFHAEAIQLAGQSRRCLNGALEAAWNAGRLMLTEKARVRRMGAGAWATWLEQHFSGTTRTAQRYVRLAQLVPDMAHFQTVSLRQAYARLGIATEPKSRSQSANLPPLPAYLLHANRLLRALQQGSFRRCTPEQLAARRADLRKIYDQLRPLYESTHRTYPPHRPTH